MEDDFTRQADEVEALQSIYPDEWRVENKPSRSYSIRLLFVTLYISLPLNYPSQAPPTYQLSAPELKRKEKEELAMLLDKTYMENLGEPVLFQWVEAIRNYLDERSATGVSASGEEARSCASSDSDGPADDSPRIPFIHGESITDRKSTFQGHAAFITSVADVEAVLAELKRNRKIASAKHNVLAYRLKRRDSVVVQDCDDDGESQAGRRLLHLLQIMDVDGVAIVVSRWYGGIHLGQDRFKHYNNAARSVLSDIGYS